MHISYGRGQRWHHSKRENRPEIHRPVLGQKHALVRSKEQGRRLGTALVAQFWR
jgi:hypothetical protein